MERWGDREIARFQFRHGLLMRRGLSDGAAERLADRLALRDQDRDDRRLCLECAALLSSTRCKHGHAVLPDVLQRCPSFNFEKP
jgi:hypothetical protein